MVLRLHPGMVVRCDANFDSIFASHFALFRTFSHFSLFCTFFWHILRIFLTLFKPFWCINREISTKKVEKVRKCEKSAMRMRCENSAMRWALTKSANANAMRKSFRTTISGYIWGIFKHFLKFEGHTSSGRHTNETLNSLAKLWSFKVIWTFFWVSVMALLCSSRWSDLNVVKQNV